MKNYFSVDYFKSYWQQKQIFDPNFCSISFLLPSFLDCSLLDHFVSLYSFLSQLLVAECYIAVKLVMKL